MQFLVGQYLYVVFIQVLMEEKRCLVIINNIRISCNEEEMPHKF